MDNPPKKLQKTGAIPKNSKAATKSSKNSSKGGRVEKEGHEFQKINSNWHPKPSEIVDDVLYIAGPLKKEVSKQKRDSVEVNDLLAFPLIPSDKFDPVNTLSKRKSRKKATSPSGEDVISNNNPKTAAAPSSNKKGSKKSRYNNDKSNKKQNAPISPLSPQMGNPNEIHAEATISTPPHRKYTKILFLSYFSAKSGTVLSNNSRNTF